MSILCSLHDAEGFEHALIGQPSTMTLRMRNRGRQAILVSARRGGSPRVSFAGAAETIELVAAGEEHWWFPNEVLSVDVPGFRIDGEAGPRMVTVHLEDVAADMDGQYQLVVMGLSPGDREPALPLAAGWTSGAELPVAKGDTARPGQLTLTVDRPAAARYYVALSSGNVHGLGALVMPEDARDVEIRAGAPWVCERVAETPRVIFSITPGEGTAGSLDVTIGGILSRRSPGFAHVVIYSVGVPGRADRFAVLPVALVNGSVIIQSFSASTTLLRNITEPAKVLLSWETVNASAVVLSTAGVVNAVQSELPQVIEETTAFVLTAYDSALDQVVSKSVTVTVDPPLASRLVPKGAIALWSGTANDIPSHWHLCNGENGTPDLRDRFVMGAGTTVAHDKGEEQQHTHGIPESTTGWRTSSVGAHTHKFPANWYPRNISGGPYSGIDTNGEFVQNNTYVQPGGAHGHDLTVITPAISTGPNSASIRPPWYALCYIMKGA